jgi:hypothetical protein
MPDNSLYEEIDQLKVFAGTDIILNYAEIIELIESIRYKFKCAFLNSYHADEDKQEDKQEDTYYVNTYPNIATQMEDDNDVIMERRLLAHKLNTETEVKQFPMYNALYKYSDADQDQILHKMFNKAKYNVENIMGINATDPNFNEYCYTEADELLKIWLSVRE